MLKVQTIYPFHVSQRIDDLVAGEGGVPHFRDRRATPRPEDQAHDRREHHTPAKREGGQLPCVLLLPRPGEDAHHDPDDVGAAGNVERLEGCVPPAVLRRRPEEIQVAAAEDHHVEPLGEQRDALCGAVVVDRPDEDAFGRRVRDVREDAEDVHARHLGCAIRDSSRDE